MHAINDVTRICNTKSTRKQANYDQTKTTRCAPNIESLRDLRGFVIKNIMFYNLYPDNVTGQHVHNIVCPSWWIFAQKQRHDARALKRAHGTSISAAVAGPGCVLMDGFLLPYGSVYTIEYNTINIAAKSDGFDSVDYK